MKVLVTGGTGTVGRLLVRRLLEEDDVSSIHVLGHSEHRSLDFKQEFGHEQRVDIGLGDVADAADMELKCEGMDLVYHLAAVKHVDLVETDPYLGMRTNIEGTKNVLHASIRAGVDRVVVMSTDKVVHASSLYGATKLVAEKIALSANRTRPIFNVFRSGNVLNSSGSVLEVWRRQLDRHEAIAITDPAMTRFIIEKGRLADLLWAMPQLPPGIVYVPKSESVSLQDLADVFMELYGKDTAQLRIVGQRAGEKMHEELLSLEELGRTIEGPDSYCVQSQAVGEPVAQVPSSADAVMAKDALRDLIATELRADGVL